jgi:thioredoxin 1
VHELTDASFEAEVLRADRPVVVDFWAPWCRPCRTVEPILEELEREHAGRVAFGRINVDEHPLTAARFGVLSLPTVLVFSNGEVRDEALGARPRSRYEEAVARVLPSG